MSSTGSRPSQDGANVRPPLADIPRIIRLFSAVYRENPSAVLRELLQNGSDAAQEMPPEARLIEVAILSRTENLESGKYHLVVRDFGEGMNQEDFDTYLLVLGRTSKHNAPNKIGEFGIGFYSTHAICREVAVVSCKCGSQETIGWRYVPRETRFYRLEDELLARLLSQDFERHPVEARRRVSGSSIYLNIDLAEFNKLNEWLIGASLARDAVLLPARLFVADYSEGREGARIPEMGARKRDLRNVSLSVDPAPWETQGPGQEIAAGELLRVALPFTPDEELPSEWYCFSKPVAGGKVAGMLFLVQGTPPPSGHIDLYLKRMRVETALDVKPIWATPVFGYVDITPGNTPSEKFDVQVPPARDHVIRDESFRKAREVIEDACAEFLAEMGKRLEEELHAAICQAGGQQGVCDIARDMMNRSALYSTLCTRQNHYKDLFMDIPDLLGEVLRQKDCPEEVRKACMEFFRSLRRGDELEVSPENLPQVFKKLGEAAQEEYRRESEAGGRAQLRWNPRASRLFFERVGPFLPITVYQREELRHGAFAMKGLRIPLRFVCHLDPALLTQIPVLVQGWPDDFLARRERGIRTVVVPDNHLTLLVIAVVAHLHPEDFPICFISHKKEVFTRLADPEYWEPLVELFRAIVAGPHSRGQGTGFEVEARGYTAGNHVPLLTTKEGERRVLVINGYNELNQSILASYRQARAANSEEAIKLLTEICHELFHHAQPAELERGGEDRHLLETRTELFKDVLGILQKYNDLKR